MSGKYSATRLTGWVGCTQSRGFASPAHTGFAFVDPVRRRVSIRMGRGVRGSSMTSRPAAGGQPRQFVATPSIAASYQRLGLVDPTQPVPTPCNRITIDAYSIAAMQDDTGLVGMEPAVTERGSDGCAPARSAGRTRCRPVPGKPGSIREWPSIGRRQGRPDGASPHHDPGGRGPAASVIPPTPPGSGSNPRVSSLDGGTFVLVHNGSRDSCRCAGGRARVVKGNRRFHRVSGVLSTPERFVAVHLCRIRGRKGRLVGSTRPSRRPRVRMSAHGAVPARPTPSRAGPRDRAEASAP